MLRCRAEGPGRRALALELCRRRHADPNESQFPAFSICTLKLVQDLRKHPPAEVAHYNAFFPQISKRNETLKEIDF